MNTLRRILVPVDFSPCSQAALEYALALAARFDAEVEVLHVWEQPLHVGPEMMIYTRDRPAESLTHFAHAAATSDMKELLASYGGHVHGRVQTGSPVDVIVKDGECFDLIVMGTRGRTGVSHFILGSVAERVARRSPCPVLTLHATASATAATPR